MAVEISKGGEEKKVRGPFRIGWGGKHNIKGRRKEGNWSYLKRR